MNVKRIIVDELPEDGCCECRFSKVYTSRFGNDKVRCAVTNKSVSDFAFGYIKQPRPSWCPMVIEETCEWIGSIKCIGRVDEYKQYKSPHEPPHYHNVIGNLDDRKRYIYCHVCGKRIKYVEVE
jgi:hypothetical protein